MARYLFDTNEIFFPVDLCKLYWESPDKRDMFGNLQTVCEDFNAVVDLERDYVFATNHITYGINPLNRSLHILINDNALTIKLDISIFQT